MFISDWVKIFLICDADLNLGSGAFGKIRIREITIPDPQP
jgi:hypothetical protein